jgi:hypothetical protein
MSEIETVVLGVVSGIMTTAFLYLVSLLVKQHIIPWYQGVTYRGVDVSGTWITEIETVEGFKAKFEMSIDQQAHNLSGDTTVIQGKDLTNPNSITNNKMNGSIWEGYITLNMQSKDRKRLSYATSLLQVMSGGGTLKGMYIFRSIRTDEIDSIETIWKRKK